MIRKQLKGAVLAAVLLLLTFGNSVQALAEAGQELSRDQLQMIDEYIQQEMKASKIPGLALGIVHGDQIIYTKGYGVANSKREPVTPDTPFYIGSVGKTFTALAIAQLAGEGSLKITDYVRQYIPWFTLADTSGREITIEELLEHTSGLSTAQGNEEYTCNGKYTLDQLVREINRRERLNRPVGESYEYSNLNYVILGLVVEYVSGISYEDYVKQFIFEPMKLTDSFASKQKAEGDGLAQGYREFYGLNVPIDFDYPMGQVPAGYQLSSAADMSKYLVYFLNNGYSGGKSILPNNRLKQPSDPVKEFEYNEPYYGLDWNITTDPAYDNYNYFYGFLGATPHFNSALLISQAHRYGIVVLINQRGIFRKPELSAQVIGNGITDILLHQTKPSSVPRTYDTKQLILPGLALILGLFSIYSCLRFRNGLRTASRKRAILLMMLGNVLLPFLFLIGVPIIYDNNWRYFLSVGIDTGMPVFILCMVLLITGAAKAYFLFLEHRKSRKKLPE